ncbi:hypothetical protein GNX18_08925 [Microbulbifer sp. SH-1]|uniref:hypothetical protein n=1 Tax=Microbulbifer sp. SH-1 TaxID=2681547 RepID=UPI001409B10C|nr:hypothetical protein [Microbulbifer sp. SH-1]QIL89860.1 hypothetical protein GNX18_08925 [Microbulbifer sp. SH-1]
MIYSDKFVWLHFPKNAGTKVEKIFSEYFSDRKDIFQDSIDGDDSNSFWHDAIFDRERRDSSFSVGDREVVICVRRLRTWLVSRYNYEKKRSPSIPHDYSNLLTGRFFESNGYLNHADYYVEKYFSGVKDRAEKISFIRIENFAEDFRRVFGSYMDVDVIPDDVLCSRDNKSYNSIPDDFLTEMKLGMPKLYEHCPKWKELEMLAYGGVEKN